MTNESIREHCLGLPAVTEVVQWEQHLLFKVGGKMFAMIDLDGHSCGVRCDPEKYAELVEMADIVPASHNMWKYHWVTMETLSAVPDREFRDLLDAAYAIVRAGLSRKAQAALEGTPPAAEKKKAGKKNSRTGVPPVSRRR